ncbi:MAG: hypothetical protein H0V89_12630 [Deltaproteobacteria bacterium]|nr:hypothetical protein [Deltaproteobacteria bacterium]
MPPDARIAVHYADGPPFRSMMDLDPAQRAAVLDAGRIRGADRFRDSRYVDIRSRVEDELYRQFRETRGVPLRVRPHYAILGRSARSEARRVPGRAYVLSVDRLPAACVSFTWGDSFRFDDGFRLATGGGHPASRRVYPLDDLPDVIARWDGSTGRPGWQEIELQLWSDPQPDDYAVIELKRVDVRS